VTLKALPFERDDAEDNEDEAEREKSAPATDAQRQKSEADGQKGNRSALTFHVIISSAGRSRMALPERAGWRKPEHYKGKGVVGGT